jgi:hypothetical protein
MERSPELEKIIVGWFEAVSRGDTSRVDHHVSQQARVRLVGTDPNEWLDGEQVAEFLKEEAKALAPTGVKVSPGEPEAVPRGHCRLGDHSAHAHLSDRQGDLPALERRLPPRRREMEASAAPRLRRHP